jgi:hypothetical protein
MELSSRVVDRIGHHRQGISLPSNDLAEKTNRPRDRNRLAVRPPGRPEAAERTPFHPATTDRHPAPHRPVRIPAFALFPARG